MADAAYHFLSFVRTGFAAALTQPDTFGSAQPAICTAQFSITVSGVSQPVTRTLSVRGPGDVIGIPAAQVVRTDPIDGAVGFEPNYFAQIEFDRPDLPWLLTPANNVGQRLRPWIALVVLDATGEHACTVTPGTPLPHISVSAGAAAQLPNLVPPANDLAPPDSNLWAHAQLITPDGESLTAAMQGDPRLSVSRLLCPRHLNPNTWYVAAVVPTFAVGRLAGLGQPVTAADEGRLDPAWQPGQAVDLPVYYSWHFRTGEDADFESLARKLQGRPLPAGLGTRPMDVSRPGAGLPAAHPPADIHDTTAIEWLDGALRPPDSDKLPARDAGARQAFQASLTVLLDRPADLLAAGDRDPIVAPPIYGDHHALVFKLDAAAAPPWLTELNLDPRTRVAAGIGTQVLGEHQEDFVARAWRQLGDVLAANRLRRAAQLARTTGIRVYGRLSSLNPAATIAITSPMHDRIAGAITQAATITATLTAHRLPEVTVQPAFRRLGRPGAAPSRAAGMDTIAATTIARFAAEPFHAPTDGPDGSTAMRPPSEVIGTPAATAVLADLGGPTDGDADTVVATLNRSRATPPDSAAVQQLALRADTGATAVVTSLGAVRAPAVNAVLAAAAAPPPTPPAPETGQQLRLVGDVGIVFFGDKGVSTALSNGDGTFQPARFVLDRFGANLGWRVDRHPRLLADLTGDGRADIVGFDDDGVWTALSNGDGTFQPARFVLDRFGANLGWRVDQHPRFLGDLTGNRRADIVGFFDDGVWTALSNGDGTFQPARRVLSDFGANNGWRVDQHPRVMADLTGDRGADIVGFFDDGVWTALSNGDGTFQPARRGLSDFGANNGWRVDRHPRVMADLTGDRGADIVGFFDDGVRTALSNGDGTFVPVQPVMGEFGFNQGWRVDQNPRLLADLTGNGRADLVGFSNHGPVIALSNGNGLFASPQLVFEFFNPNWGWGVDTPRLLADLTGDGRADIVGFGHDGVWTALSNGDGTFKLTVNTEMVSSISSGATKVNALDNSTWTALQVVPHEVVTADPWTDPGSRLNAIRGDATSITALARVAAGNAGAAVDLDRSAGRTATTGAAAGALTSLTAGTFTAVLPPAADAGTGPADRAAAAEFLTATAAALATMVSTSNAPPPADGPVLDLAAAKAGLLARIDPAVTVATRARARISDHTRPPRDDLDPVMACPQFNDSLWQAVRDLGQGWLLPGLNQIPPDTATLVRTNPSFVAAFMVGVNHEMMRELLWREYPTDQRGTAFHRFWGRSGPNPDDIGAIHQFHGHLGDNLLTGQDSEAVLLLRSELLRRYPGSIIYLSRANQVDEQLVLDDDTVQLPVFRGDLPPDVSFVGFPLTPDQLRVPGDPWYFVIAQPPTEPRFGLDDPTTDTPDVPSTASDLAWSHMAPDGNAATLAPFAIADPPALRGHAIDSVHWGDSAAVQALLTYQHPVRIAIRAADLLPPPPPPEPPPPEPPQ